MLVRGGLELEKGGLGAKSKKIKKNFAIQNKCPIFATKSKKAHNPALCPYLALYERVGIIKKAIIYSPKNKHT